MQRKRQGKLLCSLFGQMLAVSAFTFGGGFAIVSLMKKRFVDEKHWLEEQEMLDIAALAQSSPGAIAVNAAILVGWRLGGAAGMAVCVLGAILPPVVLLCVLSFAYEAFATNRFVALALKGMQAGVAAVILDVVCDLGGKVMQGRQPLHLAVMVLAFAAAWLLDVNVALIVLGAAAVGVVVALLRHGRRKGA